MRYSPFFALSLLAGLLLGACSSTVTPPESDDDVKSSSSKAKSSSSAKGGTSSEDKCVGDSGEPWDGTTAKDFACGSGTKLNPYIIKTAEQLAHLSFVIGAKDADYLEKYYKLGADIILNDGEIINEKGGLVADSTKLHKWTPIGNSSVAFAGNFDGDGHTVSGMFINTTSTHNGLFGHSSGTVQNLIVENGWVMGGNNTSAAVGYNEGVVANVENRSFVEGSKECTGGVVGQSYNSKYNARTIVKNSVNKGFISGNTAVGGVIGCAQKSDLFDLLNEGSIVGVKRVGGIVGSAMNGSVSGKGLVNKGKISARDFVGGLLGICGGGTGTCYNNINLCEKLESSINYGNVIGESYVGGVTGMLCGGKSQQMENFAPIEGVKYVAGIVGSTGYATTSAMHNVGDISGFGYVGGIFGYQKEGVTSSAYTTGKVDGDTLVGLMIGYNYNTTMADYYYLEQGDQEPFGLNNGGGVATPKSEKEMKSQEFAELLGDDFVYDEDLNDGYPVLGWE